MVVHIESGLRVVDDGGALAAMKREPTFESHTTGVGFHGDVVVELVERRLPFSHDVSHHPRRVTEPVDVTAVGSVHAHENLLSDSSRCR